MGDRPRRKVKPLITSTLVLRALAASITLSSFGGMTIFASENLHVSNAPLQPAAVASAAPAATTAATTASSTTTTAVSTATASTARTTVRGSVSSTSTAALTRTKQS